MNVYEKRRQIMLNEPHIASASGSIVSVSTDLPAPLQECVVTLTPQQSGSGDPSPSNVRAITGGTGVNVTRCGRNLFDVTTYPFTDGKFIGSTTGSLANASGFAATQGFVPVEQFAGQTLTLNKRPGGSNAGMAFYSAAEQSAYISGKGNQDGTVGTPWTFTVPNNAKYMRFTVPSGATEIQLELGSTASPYHPYSGATYPVTFPEEAGTVYGGYVDVVNGQLVAEYGSFDLGDATKTYWVKEAGDGTVWNTPIWRYDALKPFVSNQVATAFCDKLLVASYGSFSHNQSNDLRIAVDSNGRPRLRYNAYEQSTVSGLLTFLSSMQFIAELATPITYQLAPQQIKTLLGSNTLWADAAGSTLAVKLWKH